MTAEADEARLEKGRPIRFTTVIRDAGAGSGGAYVEFPFEVEPLFGTRGRVRVACTFDSIEYQGSLVRMGTACHIIGLPKAIRARLEKGIGDTVSVTVREDLEEWIAEMPPALQAELEKNPRLKESYERLSYTRKKEIAALLSSAKRPETAARRLFQILKDLE